MRLLRALLISSIICVSSSYAEEYSAFDDAGFVPEVENTQKSEEISKISILEQEVQNLTGRIEILEHNIQEMQKSIGASTFKEDSPQIPVSTEIIRKPESVSVDPKQEKRDYDLALATLKDGKYDDAEKLFGRFMKSYTNSSHLSNAYFWYAETFFRRKDFDKAAINFLKAYQKFPSSSKAPDSLLKLSLSLGEMKKNTEACSILKKLDSEFKKRSESSKKRAYDAKIRFGCK